MKVYSQYKVECEPMNSRFPRDGTGMGVELLGSGDWQEEVGH